MAPKFTPKQIRLRDVETGDLPLFFEDQRDPVAVAMVAFHSRDRAAFDQHWAKVLADPANRTQTIEAEGEVAGNVVSWTSDEQREVGYWISRAFWGRGVATAALAAFLHLEQTRPLHAGVAVHNAGSIRVLQKCGFTLLGPAEERPGDEGATHLLFTLTA